MARFAHKTYVKKMVERFGLRLERDRRGQSISIYNDKGERIFYYQEGGDAERAWEHIWMHASNTMQIYTGIHITANW